MNSKKRPEIVELEPRSGHNGAEETHRFQRSDEYKKVTSDDKNLWVRYDILPAFQKALGKRKGRDSYEDFVYGFMYHFDNHSPKEKWDVEKEGVHKLYFKWEDEDKKDNKGEVEKDDQGKEVKIATSVSIYIDPPPKEPFQKDSTVINTGIDPEKPPAPPPPPAES